MARAACSSILLQPKPESCSHLSQRHSSAGARPPAPGALGSMERKRDEMEPARSIGPFLPLIERSVHPRHNVIHLLPTFSHVILTRAHISGVSRETEPIELSVYRYRYGIDTCLYPQHVCCICVSYMQIYTLPNSYSICIQIICVYIIFYI